MSAPSIETEVKTLQHRAEQAIRSARPREQIVRLLEQLAAVAVDGSEPACFAHRHLAELRLEENPWSAALHLRRLLQVDPEDDGAQALMGLCQALQGNFRMAVSAYRRALALAPGNPWYNHNLGHLLDIALGLSHEALPYLRRANRAQPLQEEVGASLAHCLGRLGHRDEALALTRTLMEKHPRHQDLQSLLAWLERGGAATSGLRPPLVQLPGTAASPAVSPARVAREAAGRAGPHLREAPPVSPKAHANAHANTHANANVDANPRPGPPPGLDVEQAIEREMTRGGHAPAQMARAQTLWRDYAREADRADYLGKPRGTSAPAAAVEYALARIDRTKVRQGEVAARYGVKVAALSAWYTSLRRVLRLVDNDPRYPR